MTIMRWYKPVQNRGSLTVSAGSSFKGGHWMPVLDKAMADFNQQISKILKLSISKAEKEVNAHIFLETETGNGIHGTTALTPMKIGGVDYIDKAGIRVPATPRVDPKDPKSREVTAGVRLYILVHELIHAVGLSNDEHATDDVFTKEALPVPKGTYLKSGKQAADDVVQPYDGSAPMPPIRLGATTISNLQKAWPAADTTQSP
jgi:hypothetical protein